MPFDGTDSADLFKNILNKKVKFPVDFNEDLKKLIAGLLRKDPKRRYGARKVMKHKFFSGYDFDSLYKKKLEAPYHPSVKSDSDTSNFGEIKVPMLNKENCPEILSNDIFQDW